MLEKRPVTDVLGTGQWRFRLDAGWAQLPNHIKLGRVRSVAVGVDDLTYICQVGGPPVIVFDSRGDYVTSWGEGYLHNAHSIFASRDGDMYVTDRDSHRILRFRPDGTPVQELGPGEPRLEAPFNLPTAMAIAPGSGDIFASDGYANSRIHRFSAAGDHLTSWGAPGSDPGQFRVPHGIWVDRNDQVYVVDRDNDRVQVFSGDGQFLHQWTDFRHPNDIYIDQSDVIFISDDIPRMTVMTMDGTVLSRFRTLQTGHGIGGDSKGNMYVASPDGPWLGRYVKL